MRLWLGAENGSSAIRRRAWRPSCAALIRRGQMSPPRPPPGGAVASRVGSWRSTPIATEMLFRSPFVATVAHTEGLAMKNATRAGSHTALRAHAFNAPANTWAHIALAAHDSMLL